MLNSALRTKGSSRSCTSSLPASPPAHQHMDGVETHLPVSLRGFLRLHFWESQCFSAICTAGSGMCSTSTIALLWGCGAAGSACLPELFGSVHVSQFPRVLAWLRKAGRGSESKGPGPRCELGVICGYPAGQSGTAGLCLKGAQGAPAGPVHLRPAEDMGSNNTIHSVEGDGCANPHPAIIGNPSPAAPAIQVQVQEPPLPFACRPDASWL